MNFVEKKIATKAFGVLILFFLVFSFYLVKSNLVYSGEGEWSCSDGIDNDEDGYTDCGDSYCSGDILCGPPGEYCGDASCNNGEDSGSCPGDCGSSEFCGDAMCNNGEDETTCSQDCGTSETCGDASCGGSENYGNCPQDCEPPVDTTPPSLTNIEMSLTTLTLTYDESLNTTGPGSVYSDIYITINGTICNATGSSAVNNFLTVEFNCNVVQSDSVVAFYNNDNQYISDGDGNAASGFSDQTVTVTTPLEICDNATDDDGDLDLDCADSECTEDVVCEAPSPATLVSFTSDPTSGVFPSDAYITIEANFDSTLDTGSTMTVYLDTGSQVTLDTISGSKLSGTYIVQPNEVSDDLNILYIVSSYVIKMDGGALKTDYLIPDVNLATDSSIVIDAVKPTLSRTYFYESSPFQIYLEFDEILNTTVTASLFALTGDNGATPIPISGSASINDQTITLTSSLNLNNQGIIGISYTAVGSANYLQDESGNYAEDITSTTVVRIDASESSCTDGIDNDNDESLDCNDSDCAENVACVSDDDISAPELLRFTGVSGNYKSGDSVKICAVFDEDLYFSSAMSIEFDNGVTLELNSIEDSALCNNYDVQDGEDTDELSVSSVISAAIYDINNNGATGYAVPGGENISDTSNVRIDTHAPNAPGSPRILTTDDVGQSNSDGKTNLTAFTFIGTCESEEGAIIKLYESHGGEFSNFTTGICNDNEYSITVSGFTEDVYIIKATYSDVAGNESADSNTYDLDIHIGTPSITLSTSAGSDVTGPFTVTVSSDVPINLQSSDISLVRGTISSFAGSSYDDEFSFLVTPTTDGAVSVRVISNQAQDEYGNTNSASNILSFTADVSSPVISSLGLSELTDISATVAWTTNKLATSTVSYGPSATYTNSHRIDDLETSHSVTLGGLAPCTIYHYMVSVRSTNGHIATSSDEVITTAGCTGDASVESSNSTSINHSAGGTVTITDASIEIPAGFDSSNDAVFQIKKIDSESFFGSAGVPDGVVRVGDNVFNLKALIDSENIITSFDHPITVSLSYDDEDIEEIDEASLKIYRYDAGEWFELSNCEVNTTDNIVSCETNNFSDFGIFGSESDEEDEVDSGGGDSGSHSSSGSRRAVALVAVANNSSLIWAPCDAYMLGYVYFGEINNEAEVKKLQVFLNDYEGEKLLIDGIFKAEDHAAVMRFQIKYRADILDKRKLKNPTGDVGKATLGKINELVCEKKKGVSCPVFGTNLKIGDISEDVINVRKFLAFNQGETIDLVSASFDWNLFEAIKRFQVKYQSDILTPNKISLPTGNWFGFTQKKANELLGCFTVLTPQTK